jgi:hypothetical protein
MVKNSKKGVFFVQIYEKGQFIQFLDTFSEKVRNVKKRGIFSIFPKIAVFGGSKKWAEKRSPKRLPFSSIKGSENYGYVWILFVFGRIMQSGAYA